MKIIAYSDYVCPWCYIGFRTVQRLQREHGVEVEWRPFELHPETPATGADLRGRLGSSARAAAYAQNIIVLAGETGIEGMRMPGVVSNSHLALEAAECARVHGGFDRYHEALFEAYFVEGRDVGDAEVLCAIARDAGVDDQRVRQALLDRTYRDRVDAVTRAAREDEVVSTPTFIFEGGFRMTGAQEYAVFESITRRLESRSAAREK